MEGKNKYQWYLSKQKLQESHSSSPNCMLAPLNAGCDDLGIVAMTSASLSASKWGTVTANSTRFHHTPYVDAPAPAAPERLFLFSRSHMPRDVITAMTANLSPKAPDAPVPMNSNLHSLLMLRPFCVQTATTSRLSLVTSPPPPPGSKLLARRTSFHPRDRPPSCPTASPRLCLHSKAS